MKITDKAQFDAVNVFGAGAPNTAFAQYFIGESFLIPLTDPKTCPLFLANVTFEPGCRNNWHIHHAKSGGGQRLGHRLAAVYVRHHPAGSILLGGRHGG